MHRHVEFILWPKVMGDQNPFKQIWPNISNKLPGDFYELTEPYVSWEEMRTDFDNFHIIYENIKI